VTCVAGVLRHRAEACGHTRVFEVQSSRVAKLLGGKPAPDEPSRLTSVATSSAWCAGRADGRRWRDHALLGGRPTAVPGLPGGHANVSSARRRSYGCCLLPDHLIVLGSCIGAACTLASMHDARASTRVDVSARPTSLFVW